MFMSHKRRHMTHEVLKTMKWSYSWFNWLRFGVKCGRTFGDKVFFFLFLFFIKIEESFMGWRDISAVKIFGCSSRGPVVGSQHLHGI